MNNLNYRTIRRTFSAWTVVYDWLTPIYLLGNEGRLRRTTVQALYLRKGQVVLDVACGTGRNFPYILEKIGSHGALVGIDYTPQMLERAHKRVVNEGWQNVDLIQGDAAGLDLDQEFDAALSTLAMSVIPDYHNAIARMKAHLSPDGRLAIADAKLSEMWYARPFKIVADLLGWGAATDVSRPIWETVERLVDGYLYQEWFMGFFYVAAGQIKE